MYFYILCFISTILPLIFHYFSKQFYIKNPDYLVHSMWNLNYGFKIMVKGFLHLDRFFRYLTPVFWLGNWVVVLVIFLLGALTLKTSWQKSISLIVGVLFILTLLGVNKINDDMGVIFLSSTRMFLAIPLLFGLALFWTKMSFENEKNWRKVILTIAVSVFLVKISCYETVLKKHTEKTNYGAVAIKKLDDLISECYEIKQIISQYDVDLVVFMPNAERNEPSVEFYNYGCPILEQISCTTVMNVYERRTWVFLEEKSSVRKNILLSIP